MAMIEIQAPNGEIVQFPAGTALGATIKSVMAKNYGGPQQPVSLQTFRTQYPQYSVEAAGIGASDTGFRPDAPLTHGELLRPRGQFLINASLGKGWGHIFRRFH